MKKLGLILGVAMTSVTAFAVLASADNGPSGTPMPVANGQYGMTFTAVDSVGLDQRYISYGRQFGLVVRGVAEGTNVAAEHSFWHYAGENNADMPRNLGERCERIASPPAPAAGGCSAMRTATATAMAPRWRKAV